METVQPIRDITKIEGMKQYLLKRPFGARNHLLFTLGINSGLRVSALLRLKLNDITDETGCPAKRIRIREKKTGKEKNFPVTKKCQAAIELYLGTLAAPKPNAPVFLSKKGGPITRQAAWQILNAAAEAVGIKENIGTHTLRKTWGYHSYNAGAPLEVIQAALNHTSPKDTLRYIGITQDDVDDIYAVVDL